MAEDAASPTSMILGYLSSKGLPPSSANVRAALQLNATNPGLIPGLSNEAPPPAEAPQAPVGGVGQGGGGVKLPTPPMPPGYVAPNTRSPGEGAMTGGGGAVPPPTDDSQGGGLMSQLIPYILSAVGAGGAGLGAYGMSKLGNSAAPTAPATPTAPPEPLRLAAPEPQPEPQPRAIRPASNTESGPPINMPPDTRVASPTQVGPHMSSGVGHSVPTTPGAKFPTGAGLDWGKILGTAGRVAKGIR